MGIVEVARRILTGLFYVVIIVGLILLVEAGVYIAIYLFSDGKYP